MASVDNGATASFDGNTWWWITETRVNYTSALFWSNNALAFGVNDSSNAGMYWQLYTLPNGNVQFRNKNSNTLKQLGTCYNADEVSSSKLQMCMEASTSDDDQQWTIEAWGDGTYKINNVANGTTLNADWHPGGPGFMSPSTAASPIQPAQHWLFSSIGIVQDGLYSTSIQPSSSVSTSTATATAKTTTPASVSASATAAGSSSSASSTASATQQKSSSGLSGGAAAGIGIGVAAAVLIFAALAFLLVRRRKRTADGKPLQELPGGEQGPYGPGSAVAGQAYEKTAPVHEAPSNEPSYEMYNTQTTSPVELPSGQPGGRSKR